ncbi:cell wall galactomannoprotein mp2 allergen f17-like protein [Colletotrichum incanum]|uniref:Cell wall galactomannoprotein mp2 allergen f17-like protein n=1 Tax=Colletotrichum incanum TaxID=1573173 RepID=A0A167A3T1_COLIC|nr:cell wall galactomannoprotein mp2 allergen f17-like protein [Colletotrichum incanum]
MQLHSLLSFSLAAVTVLAAPVSIQQSKYKRDLATIQAALNTINSALQGLDNSVKATNSVTIGGGIQLLGAVGGVKTSIEDATTQVQASQVLNKQDAKNLKAATDALTNNVKVTINDVVAKKGLVDSLGATPLVAVALQDQKTASVALAQALVSKVPPELNADAQKSASALSTVLDQGIGIFGGTTVAPPATAAPAEGAAVCQAVDSAAAAAPPAADSAASGGGGILGGLMGFFGGLMKH